MSDPALAYVIAEQRMLWHDLDEALRCAIDGVWSIRASQAAVRILAAALVTGPSDPGGVPWPLVAGGVYHAALAAGGIRVSVGYDDAEWARLDTLMSQYGTTRAGHLARYAETVTRIGADAAWLRNESAELLKMSST